MNQGITIPVLTGTIPGDSDARALASLIELAIAMGQHQVATDLHRRLKALPLSDDERQRVYREFAVLEQLR